MRGTPHEVCINPYISNITRGKGVGITNIDDPYYDCVFETREEVDKLIKELVEARDKVFGKEKKVEAKTR